MNCNFLSIFYCLDLKAQASSVSGFSIELEAPINSITADPPNKSVQGNESLKVNVPVYDLPTGVYAVEMKSEKYF